MPNLVVRMSDEQHKRLEAHRATFGLRSLNAAMLHLIDMPHGPELMARAYVPPPARTETTPAAVAEIKCVPVAKPHKSRLKGEWKAP